ncbi:hypothetical protein [Nocardia brasiliensis]|uniref:hypothetical protein n=1 Tax=Nocardia brasiliensis TaxID=37326 RepID=UPI002456266C|nr:hypothetical protein [Nocardia brasiliensis]
MTVQANADKFTHWEMSYVPHMFPTEIEGENIEVARVDLPAGLLVIPRALNLRYDVDDEFRLKEAERFLIFRFGIHATVTRIRRLRFDPSSKSFRGENSEPSPFVAMLADSIPAF